MLIFADGNTTQSLRHNIGSEWLAFLQPASFAVSSIETLTVDELIASHIGVMKLNSMFTPNKSLKFTLNTYLLPNPACGAEDMPKSDNGNLLYRVGIKGVSGQGYTKEDKLRLILDNYSQFVKPFSATNDPAAVVTFDLVKEVIVDKIFFTCNTVYTVECFTDKWVPFTEGTKCSKLRITLTTSIATVTASNLSVYTKDASAVGNSSIAAYAILVGLNAPEAKTPYMVVDVADWKAVGTFKLSSNVVGPAKCPTLLNFELKPVLLEV